MNIYYRIIDSNISVYFTAGVHLILFLSPVLRGVCTKSRAVRMYHYFDDVENMENMEFMVPLNCEEVYNIIKEYEHLL